MLPPDLLRRIRNDLPMAVAIARLGRDGPPSKLRDGRFVFLCPRCCEMLAYVNPKTISPTASSVTPTSTPSICWKPAATTSSTPSRSSNAGSTSTKPGDPATEPRRERRFAGRVGIPRWPSPEFAGIRQAAHQQGQIPTARIW